MDYGIAIAHRSFGCGRIADVAATKTIVRIIRDRIEISQIARIGQLVVVNDGIGLAESESMTNEIRADEPGTACDEEPHLDGSVCAKAFAVERLLSLFAPVSATRLFARSKDSNVPASVHQPSRIS